MINQQDLERIYETVKTPYKYGAVLKTAGKYCDSPVVFKHNGAYYMTCVEIDDQCKTGYRTKLLASDNLTEWNALGYILTEHNDWDSAQTGSYAQFVNNEFGGNNEIIKINGKYFVAYLGGSLKGYETDPLWMGLATCDDIENINGYRKLPKPILTTLDEDCREEESVTLYKADMFVDEKRTTGYPYVCAYNAKRADGRESIFLAVSNDAYTWKRYGDKAIVSVGECEPSIRINGDPQIVKIDDLYVMFYFIYDSAASRAWNTFAVSEDLLNWVKWNGKPLIESEHEWENVYAHKQWILKEKDTIYHFYCAVNDKNERFIALATNNKNTLP